MFENSQRRTRRGETLSYCILVNLSLRGFSYLLTQLSPNEGGGEKKRVLFYRLPPNKIIKVKKQKLISFFYLSFLNIIFLLFFLLFCEKNHITSIFLAFDSWQPSFVVRSNNISFLIFEARCF